jgi:hypothetical protein
MSTEDDIKIVKVFRVLKPNGKFLIDVAGGSTSGRILIHAAGSGSTTSILYAVKGHSLLTTSG